MSSIDQPILNTAFRVIAQQETVEILSPTLVREVVECTSVEEPDGVVFMVRVPLIDWKQGLRNAFIQPYADQISIIMNQPLVVDADFVQTSKPSGQIIDFLDIFVSHDGGDSWAIVHQPFGHLDFSLVGPKIDAAASALKQG